MTEQQISWMALSSGTLILTSDGAELGRVQDVVADQQKDIFSGVTFSEGIRGGIRFVPAALIVEITDGSVKLNVTEAEAGQKIEPYDD